MLSSFGGPEIAFDPQNQQEGIYTIYGETGRINAVHDLSAEKFAGACPFVLRDFPIKYRIVTVSVRPPGYKRVWFAGINLSSN